MDATQLGELLFFLRWLCFAYTVISLMIRFPMRRRGFLGLMTVLPKGLLPTILLYDALGVIIGFVVPWRILGSATSLPEGTWDLVSGACMLAFGVTVITLETILSLRARRHRTTSPGRR